MRIVRFAGMDTHRQQDSFGMTAFCPGINYVCQLQQWHETP